MSSNKMTIDHVRQALQKGLFEKLEELKKNNEDIDIGNLKDYFEKKLGAEAIKVKQEKFTFFFF